VNGWKALGFNTYQDYLYSDIWIERRELMIKMVGKCELCGAINRLQVHHITYLNVGNEKKEDLMVVCKTCHTRIHKEKKQGCEYELRTANN